MADLNYIELRRLQQEEKSSAALVMVPTDFYGQVDAMLKAKKDTLGKSHTIMDIREYENTAKIVREIHSMRQQKIILRALRLGTHNDTGGMTVEEHHLYDQVCAILEDSKSRFESNFSEKTVSGAAQSGPNGGTSSLKKVRFLKEVAAFTGLDNNVYGPFKPGEIGELPESETSALLKARIAEQPGG